MMYSKKILVLKEITANSTYSQSKLGGIARIEIEDGVSSLFLSLINFPSISNGSYFVFILDTNSNLFYYDIGSKPISFFHTFDKIPNIDKGFYVGVVSLVNNLPITLCYAQSDELTLSLTDFKKTVAETCALLKRERELEQKSLYNDEAVATENYYTLDEQIADKLKDISQNERIRSEDDVADSISAQETQEGKGNFGFYQDEKPFSESKTDKDTVTLPFFLREKEELDNIFNKFPKYTLLSNSIPNSVFVKIDYSSDKYYVVGIVKENEKEKYICYGVPSMYSSTPPEELKDYCVFIPLSKYNPYGEGFFMMYQDAISGDCVKKSSFNI